MHVPPVIEVVPYNPDWPRHYEMEAKKIRGALGKNCVTVVHIGSTAVPGLAAKPIIDIIIVVKDILELDKQISTLEELGYVTKGEYGVPFRRYFQKKDGLQGHNVHIFEEGSPEIERHIHFRDYLRLNSETCQEYAALKMALAKQYPYDINAYCNAKDAFIQKVSEKSPSDKVRIVVAFTTREWEKVKSLRKAYCQMAACPDELIMDNHSHVVLLQGTRIIGYADISLTPQGQAHLAMLIIETGFEQYREEFMAMLERWFMHQDRVFIR